METYQIKPVQKMTSELTRQQLIKDSLFYAEIRILHVGKRLDFPAQKRKTVFFIDCVPNSLCRIAAISCESLGVLGQIDVSPV